MYKWNFSVFINLRQYVFYLIIRNEGSPCQYALMLNFVLYALFKEYFLQYFFGNQLNGYECFLSFCLDFVYDWPSAVFKDKNFIYLIVFKGLQNGVSAKYELLLMGLHELLNYKRASGEVEKYCAIIFSIY